MEGVLQQAVRFLQGARRAESTACDPEERKLREELSDVRLRMESARCRFENLLEEELVDAAIYEMAGLERRYNYLLRKMKQKGYS